MNRTTRTRVLTRAGLSVGAALTASVLALTLVAAGVSVASAAPRALDHARTHHSHDAQGLRGRVTAVTSTSLTIGNDGRSSTFTLDANTAFVKNDLAIPASDVTIGSIVRVTRSTTTATTPPTASSVALLASPEVKMGHGVEGTVYSVAPTSIVITHEGQQMTFAIDANTVFVMNGMPATIANVLAGARVRVAVSTTATTTPTASAIMIFANESDNANAVSGTVTAYAQGTSITVAGPNGPATFSITPATIITKDHVALLASDISTGSVVRVFPTTATTTPLTAGIIALEGESHARGLRGRVTAVTSTSLTIGNDGQTSSFTLGANTVFVKNGLAIPASDITVGAKVLVTLSSTTATTPPTASSVALLASPEVKMGHGVEGTVYSVAPSALVITHEGQQMTFAIDANTAFVMNGMPASIANVLTGARVRVVVSTTATTTPTASAIMIFANESENANAFTGTVTAYVPDASITVMGPNGPTTFVITPATIITKDHVALLASDVSTGSVVRVIPTTATTTPPTAGIISLED